MTKRLRWALGAAVMDGLAFAGAYLLALSLRNSSDVVALFSAGHFVVDWSLLVMLGIVWVSFLAFGLYENEVCVSRSLLLRTLVKGTLVATVLSAATVYLLKSPSVSQSRFLVLGTFFLFGVIAAVLRIGVGARSYSRAAAHERPVTIVVGRSPRGEVLTRRLNDLKAHTRWRRVEDAAEVGPVLDTLREQGRRVTAVFIDADGLPLPAVLPAVIAARDRRPGAVYVMSDLLRPLQSNRLLFQLYEAPVIRVRAEPPNGAMRRTKRVMDVAGAGLTLIVLGVPTALIALAVRLSSPGPILYRQVRVGRRGAPFEFLKFRSMVVGDHHEAHRAYVEALIQGETRRCDQGDQEEQGAVLKLAEDGRITSVGRFIRRYSLDELPQLWNVVRGDMSLVGPRPPLPYEVKAYNAWQRQRLQAVPGISGIWQVGGRSRVAFDEMVFQDLFYSLNQSPYTDALICVRTVPAVINGRGAV